DKGYEVSLETSGAMSILDVDERVVTVLDLKTPGSLECDRNLESNIALLKPQDQVKFVICDRRDYEWAKAKCDQYDLRSRVDEVLFSPSFGQLEYKELAEWILADKLQVRMQLQLHKLIWGDKPGH
ncbi:MAG: 7-carboxy-7-deazaguanine synthase QueE, partial [Pseudohongiellaceae bacterium]